MSKKDPSTASLRPSDFGTPADFISGLRLLKARAGNPSLRDLARATGIPRSTLAASFDANRAQLPPIERCLIIIRALRVGEPQAREWAAAWKRLQGAEQLKADEDSAAAPDSEPGADMLVPERLSEAVPRPRQEHRRLAAAFALGAVLAVLATLTIQHLTRPAAAAPTVIVGDYAICKPADLSPSASGRNPKASQPPHAPQPAHPVSWIARPAFDAQILTTTNVTLPVTTAVAHGNALIVSVMLTSTCPGEVKVTDSQDNHYRTIADVTDTSRHRILLFAAFDADDLSTADAIKVSYPQASKYHVAVDEFSGLTAVNGYAVASGPAGGTAFTTSATSLSCAAGELQVAAIGTNSGDAPTPSAEWTVIPPVLKLSSYRLTTAYRVTRATGPCAVTGATTAQWAAAIATLS